MNRRVKQAMMARRDKARRYGSMEYIEPYNEHSGSFRVSPDGTRYPVYPGMEWPDMRFRDRTGREHYDNGRFAPTNSVGYPYTPYNPIVPPVYERDGREHREYTPMNKIGFVVPKEDDMGRYKGNEMGYQSSEQYPGYAQYTSDAVAPMSSGTAVEWVNRMKNADGTTGAHFTMEQVRQFMEQQKIQCDELEFYVAINMMYSDYCKVAKRHNCNTMEFYGGMAKAFLDDKDAQPEKLTRYYEYIAKH